MAFYTFQSPAAEVLGTDGNNGGDDIFIASNLNLNAGDRAIGGAGTDELQYFADSTLTGSGPLGTGARDFSGFVLDSVELFTVTNDAGRQINFDLSSTLNPLTEVRASNSTSAIAFDQLTSLANVRLIRQTNVTTADVFVGYQAAVLAGQSNINLTLDNTNGDLVRIGTSTATLGAVTNSGVEQVTLQGVGGDSTIRQLDTNLTTLILADSAGAFDITITDALNTTVRTITSQTDGDVDLGWENNTVGVTYTGSNTASVNTLGGGSGNDVITTFGGADVISAGAGDDQINAGNGENRIDTGTGVNTVVAGADRDRVVAGGSSDTLTLNDGNDVVDARANGTLIFNGGTGNDIVYAEGTFDASNAAGRDRLTFGAGTDFLMINAGSGDGAFFNVTGLEYVLLTTGGTTTLGANATAAGVDSVILYSGSNAADTVDLSNVGRSVTVRSFNTDAVLADDPTLPFAQRFLDATSGGANNDAVTGTAFADAFEFRGDGSLTGADTLDGRGSAAGTNDGLYLEGDTTLNTTGGGVGFRGFEFVGLESAYGSQYRNQATANGNIYNLVLSDANAPSAGRDLVINGSNLNRLNNGLQPREDAVISTAAVTAFRSVITTGAGFDTVSLGQNDDIAATGAGDDTVFDGTGNNLIDTGLGNDTVNLLAGNNTVFDEGGNNTITLGSGNDTVFVGNGNDRIIAGGNLTSADTLVDNGGNDTIQIGTRNYVDNDFAGVAPTGSSTFENLEITGDGTNTVLGANAQRAGFTTVTSLGAGASTIDAGAFTRSLTVDVTAGGDDIVILGSGDDLVLAGTGNQTVIGNGGNDRLRVDGAELTTNDVFRGGAGVDVVEMDNTNGAVTAVVNLSNFVSVESYRFLFNGDRPGTPDVDNNTLTFGNANANTVNTLTAINIDLTTLTDTQDSTTVTLDPTLNDADFAFNITGNATSTTLIKNNLGINNNINFQGGSGADTFVVGGLAGASDLGSTTVFNGNGGIDVIFQQSGVINDDSYVQVSNVEVLTGAVGAINATLGAEASQSGLIVVRGTTGTDRVTLDAAFTTALRMELGNGGNDLYDASATAAAITFAVRNDFLNAGDVLQGGTSAGDVLEITTPLATSAGDATSVTGVETINVRLPGQTAAITDTTLTIDTLIGEVNGGRQTINVTETAPDNGSTQNDFNLNAQTATANLTVTSASGFDVILTGIGNDVISTGDGQDRINAGNGNNNVDAGAANDDVITGNGTDTINLGAGSDTAQAGGGNDTVNGGDGIDFIRGQGGDDTLNGDGGNDQIQGGVGTDIMDGGAGNDTFYYNARNQSNLVAGGRDTINNFVSGSDTVDALSVAEAIATYGAGAQVAFRGNQANFGDAQSVINDNDGIFDIVYQQDTHTLWFDLNDDGTLNGDDLQIIVNISGGNTLTGGDVLAGQTVGGGGYAAFDAVFPTF